MKRWLGYTLLVFAIVSFAAGAASAQKKEGSMDCRDGSWNGDQVGGTYGTAVALLILQLPYKNLPIMQR